MKTRNSAVILYLDECRGTKIPTDFWHTIHREQWEGLPDMFDVLLEPDHELYWEIWQEVLDNAVCTDENGDEYKLHQDGTVWLYDISRMTCEEKESFGWNVEESERRAEALVLALGDAIEEKENVTEHGHDEDVYTYNGNCYLVVNDEEADRRAHDHICESLWAFNTDFILDHVPGHFNSSAVSAFSRMQQELCEDANSLIAAMIPDVSGFVDDAISADGRGHFLASYDGEELEHGEFFIYRID